MRLTIVRVDNSDEVVLQPNGFPVTRRRESADIIGYGTYVGSGG